MSNYSYLSRRKFFNYIKLSFVFLVTSCTKVSKNIVVGFQKSFFPESFKNLFPKNWDRENIDLKEIYNPKNFHIYNKIDYILINDGWINKIKFDDFTSLNTKFFSRLSDKSINYLSSFDENISNKLFPIGVIPYAVVIKNNEDIKNIAKESWDFLLFKDLKGKIILPNSPRIILSIAEKVDDQKALNKIINQQNIYNDKYALDWFLNSKAVIAVLPYSLCQTISKIDSRISLVFPRNGVPLLWQFFLCKSFSNQKPLLNWINSFENTSVLKNLLKDGWYLPFKDKYIQDFYSENFKVTKNGPSNECWENSWSLPNINKTEKIEIERLWKTLLTP